MVCITKSKEGAEILLNYASGALDAPRAAELERHLPECEECRRLVDAQVSLWSTLDAFDAPEVSPDFDRKLYARMAQQKRPFWRQFLPIGPVAWWKPAVPVAVAASLLSVMLVTRSFDAPAVSSVQPGMSRVELEQVEQALDDLEMLAPPPAPAM